MFWKKHKPKKATESLDSTPVAMPVKFHRPPTLQEQIQRYTRATLNKMAEQTGHETFEEANDFDVGEDLEPASLHELEFGEQGERRFEEFVAKNLAPKGKAASQLKADKAGPAGPVVEPKNVPQTPPNAEA